MKKSTGLIKALATVALLGISNYLASAASTDTWVGNTDTNWNTAANWDTVAVPANGDSLVFGTAGSLGATLNNNITSLSVNNFTINSGASAFTFNGNALTLTGGLTNNATSNGQHIGLALSGAGSLNQAGTQRLYLSGANTYSGATTIGAGATVEGDVAAAYSANSDYTVNGVLESYTGSGGFSMTIGALNGSGTVYNTGGGSSQTTTLTVGANGNSGSFSGPINNGAWGSQKTALTKAGAGTQTFSGVNTYSGATTVSAGTLNYSGTLGVAPATAAGAINVGVSGGVNAILNIPSGATIRMNNANLLAGNGTTVPVGDGFVFQSGGTITGMNQLQLGAAASGASYGYYNLSGSASISMLEFDLGGFNGAAVGVLDMSGGTMNVANWLVPSRGTGGTGILNMMGGALNYNGPAGQFMANWNNNGGSVAVLNLANASLIALNANVNMMQTGTAGKLGEINLLSGGLLQANSIAPGSATGTSLLNFNGGTLKASTATTNFITANNTAVNVYSGGGAIDNNGVNITIPKALAALTGSGINSAVSFTGGSGYVGAPAVVFSGGGGVGAAGYATISGGAVNGIVVTCPGTGYTSAPTVTLTGGGYTSAATATAPTPTTNTPGGLTFQGSGITTLTGANTYTGNTTISAGTLALAAGGSINGTASITVSNGAIFDVSAAGYTLATSTTSLRGYGVVTGAVTTASTTKVFAGADGVAGTLSFSNNLTMASGSSFSLDVTTSPTSGNDQLIVAGTLMLNSTVLNIKALSGSANLNTSSDYVLVTAGTISGSPSPVINWVGTAPANAANFTVVSVNNSLVLRSATATPPTITSATVNPTTVTRGGRTVVTAAVTQHGNPFTVTVSSPALAGTVTLVSNGAGSYTNAATIATGAGLGTQTLTVTATDTQLLAISSNITVTVTVTGEVWNGNGSDNNWSTGANWVSGVQPLTGDSVAFAGSSQLTANMDTSNNLAALTFNSGAGSFNITGSDTLSLTGGVTNNSANAQTIAVPVAFSGPQTINTAAGDLAISGAVSGGAIAKTGAGTLTLAGANTYSGATTIATGTLTIGDPGLLGNGTYSAAITNNGALNFSSSQNQTLSGVISGTGSLTNSGSGTLTLSGANSYAGSTTVSGGTLKLAGSAPVLHLSFDNVSGSTVINDGAGGSAMNGTMNGSATIVSGGKFGSCLNISGANAAAASCRIANSVVPLNVGAGSQWTVAMWIKTSTAGACYGYQGDGNWANANTTFYLNPGSAVSGTHAGAVRYAQGWETGTATVNDGQWHQVVLECNGTTRLAYVDGNLDSLTTDGWTGTGLGGQFWIGGSADNGDGTANLNGQIDEVFVYDRPLSQTDIQSLYNNNAIKSGLPVSTVVNVASGATLDLGGMNQQIASLTGSGSVVLGDNSGMVGNLTVSNANVSVFDGVISDSGSSTVTKVGTGALVLTGANTYSGATIVSNGTLNVAGSLSSPVTVVANAKLSGLGSLSGTVTVGGDIAAGSNAIPGALTINANLNFAPGGTATFSLDTTVSGANDSIVANGGVASSFNVIHIKAPSTSVNLDAADYVLVDNYFGSGISGSFQSQPVWDVMPLNHANYVIQNNGNQQIVLHYFTATPPTAKIALTPSTVGHNQSSLVTVTVTPGSSGTITGVTLDTSSLGGSSILPLNQVGATLAFTNSISAITNVPGVYTLAATVSDSAGASAMVYSNLTVIANNCVWNGNGGDDNWSSSLNWIGYPPGFVGDSVTFAGSTRTTPNMDNNYSVVGLTFSNNAASFTVGSGNTLTLTGGVTNNSPNAQVISAPISIDTTETFSTAAGSITVNGGVSGAGTLAKSGSGSLILAGANTYTGNTLINGGALQLGDGVSVDGSLVGNITDNASLIIANTAAQTFFSAISGTGKVVKTAAGKLTLTGNNTHSGGTFVENATLIMPRGLFGTLGSGALTLSNALVITQPISGSDPYNNGNSVYIGNSVTVPAGTTNIIDNSVNNYGNLWVGNNTAQWTGSGTVKFQNNSGVSAPGVLWCGSPLTGFHGAVEFGSGTANNHMYVGIGYTAGESVVSTFDASGTAWQMGDMGNTLCQNVGVTLVRFGSLSGANTGSELRNGIYEIGALNTNSTYAGRITSGSTLIKVGTGTLTLSGANTYTGPTTVSNGTLVVSTIATGGGAYTVVDGATLGVSVANGGSLNLSSLSLGNSTNSYIGISSTTVPAINNSGALTLAGTVIVNVSGIVLVGQYPLIASASISGTGGFVVGTLPSGVAANIATNGSTIVLNVTTGSATYVWTGLNNNSWDKTTANNWTANGGAAVYQDGVFTLFNDSSVQTNVNATVTVAPSATQVTNNSRHYTLASAGGTKLTGSGSLTKSGSGILTLTGLNSDFTGGVSITGGTVEVLDNTNLGAGSVTLNGGTLSVVQGFVNARTLSVGTNGGTLSVASGQTFAVSNVIGNSGSGLGGLVKSGSGTLQLSANNTYAGGTVVSNGTLQVGVGGSTGSLGAGDVTNNAALVFDLNANVTAANNISGTGTVTVGGGSRLHFTGTHTESGSTIINSGSVLEINSVAAFSPNSDYTVNGVLESYAGTYLPSATIGALNGSGTVFNTANTAGTTEFILGANGSTGTFSGVIANGAWGGNVTALTKTGAGTQTLNGVNTYSGATTITAGTLLVDGGGVIGGAVAVNGGAFGGTGTVSGAVTVNSGGTLVPGTAAVGSLTVNNNLTLSGNTLVKVNKSLSPAQSNDVVNVSGVLTYGGTLTVTNLGSVLAVGDSFQVFPAGGTGSITVSGNAGAGLAFSFADGVVSVVTGGPSGPAVITNSISGNTLHLSWPVGQGWRLEAQTNNLTTGLNPTGWSTVSGVSDGSATITIDAAKPSVFYRLVNP